jgi:hypothetical protein
VSAPVTMSRRITSSGGPEKEQRPGLASTSTFRWVAHLRAMRRVHGVVSHQRNYIQANRADRCAGQGPFCSALTAWELVSDPLFAGIPPKFLLWQQGLALRRRVKRGQVLCRQGDAGNTAFIIRRGRFKVTAFADVKSSTWLGRPKPLLETVLTPDDMIVGEMACLSGSPVRPR